LGGRVSLGVIVLNETEAEAVLENCRALINHIIARLSAKASSINASSAAELLLHLEFAASALKRNVRTPPASALGRNVRTHPQER
jgi:hypothetical protein